MEGDGDGGDGWLSEKDVSLSVLILSEVAARRASKSVAFCVQRVSKPGGLEFKVTAPVAPMLVESIVWAVESDAHTT